MDELAGEVEIEQIQAVEHVRGPDDAPVTVVEFGDYECPYCAAAAPVLRELVARGDGQVRLVFRNFPLFDIHPYALTAALAAEASEPLGVFWQMHDLLFQRQDRLKDKDLRAYGDSLGVDGSLLIGDAAQRFGEIVEADYEAGIDLGVSATPTLFLNGARYAGRVDLESLERTVSRLCQRDRLAPWARR